MTGAIKPGARRYKGDDTAGVLTAEEREALVSGLYKSENGPRLVRGRCGSGIEP